MTSLLVWCQFLLSSFLPGQYQDLPKRACNGTIRIWGSLLPPLEIFAVTATWDFFKDPVVLFSQALVPRFTVRKVATVLLT